MALTNILSINAIVRHNKPENYIFPSRRHDFANDPYLQQFVNKFTEPIKESLLHRTERTEQMIFEDYENHPEEIGSTVFSF
jgi:hypothetical protein